MRRSLEGIDNHLLMSVQKSRANIFAVVGHRPGRRAAATATSPKAHAAIP
ncbi:MAG: hypothetical protein KJO98_15430 [Rhodothermia bacterium]|nr:hypothetical protein [Rhodothermia bacterium]